MTPLLELNAVSKQFGQHGTGRGQPHGEPGEVIVIPGRLRQEHLLRTLNGLEPIQGDIRFDGELLDANTDWQRCASGSAWCSRAITFPNLTVLENVLPAPLRCKSGSGPRPCCRRSSC